MILLACGSCNQRMTASLVAAVAAVVVVTASAVLIAQENERENLPRV
jgi:hypothetical protein